MCISESVWPRLKGAKVCRGVGLCRVFLYNSHEDPDKALIPKKATQPYTRPKPCTNRGKPKYVMDRKAAGPEGAGLRRTTWSRARATDRPSKSKTRAYDEQNSVAAGIILSNPKRHSRFQVSWARAFMRRYKAGASPGFEPKAEVGEVRQSIASRESGDSGKLDSERSPPCFVGATETDHIVPLQDGGAKYDDDNLQPLCRTCHQPVRPIKRRACVNGVMYADARGRGGGSNLYSPTGRDQAVSRLHISAFLR